MPVKSPDPRAGVLLLSFQASWTSQLAVATLVVVLVWYIAATRRAAARARPFPVLNTACFVAGLVVIAYAVEGGVAHYQKLSFTAHVVGLMLLTFVAPPLLAMGSPVRLALLASSGRVNSALLALLRSRASRVLTHPAVAFGAAMATLYLYFLTPLYAISERHPVFLAYVNLQFVLAGCLLWWVIVSRDAMPRVAGFGARFVLVVLLVPATVALGIGLSSLSTPLFAAANTLADTHEGGNVLWELSQVLIVTALGFLFVDWAREEERRARRADRQVDAAIAAARAVIVPGDAGGYQPGGSER